MSMASEVHVIENHAINESIVENQSFDRDTPEPSKSKFSLAHEFWGNK